MPRAPRGKQVRDARGGSYQVVGRASKGDAQPYFDRSRNVWVAPWMKPDGKIGRPTGRTKALAEASRDRHIADVVEAEKLGPMAEGFAADTTVGELAQWWLHTISRHRVRASTWATYEKQLRLIGDSLGAVPVRKLRPEQVATFVSNMVSVGSESRARNVRMLLVQIMDEAVNLGLAHDNVVKKVRPPKVRRVSRQTLSPDEVRLLLDATDERFVAAVALCYVQGWRISEALGLAWQDVDLDAGTVWLRRAATYVDKVGMVLGPTKTPHTAGRQLLGPTVVEHLRKLKVRQDAHREHLGKAWPTTVYKNEKIDLVFINAIGTHVLRQHVDRAIRKAGASIGLDPANLGTHDGRRSVVTNLYASGNLDLGDIARFVGHSDVATTRGYIQSEGERPLLMSQKALELLDPSGKGEAL